MPRVHGRQTTTELLDMRAQEFDRARQLGALLTRARAARDTFGITAGELFRINNVISDAEAELVAATARIDAVDKLIEAAVKIRAAHKVPPAQYGMFDPGPSPFPRYRARTERENALDDARRALAAARSTAERLEGEYQRRKRYERSIAQRQIDLRTPEQRNTMRYRRFANGDQEWTVPTPPAKPRHKSDEQLALEAGVPKSLIDSYGPDLAVHAWTVVNSWVPSVAEILDDEFDDGYFEGEQ